MKKILSAVLAVLMLLTVCAGALAAPVQLSAADADAQIRFIYSKLSTMKQNEAKKAWSYAITDLDRNGQLELLAASEHDADHTTTLMVWEVNKSIDTMVKCVVKVELSRVESHCCSIGSDGILVQCLNGNKCPFDVGSILSSIEDNGSTCSRTCSILVLGVKAHIIS